MTLSLYAVCSGLMEDIADHLSDRSDDHGGGGSYEVHLLLILALSYGRFLLIWRESVQKKVLGRFLEPTVRRRRTQFIDLWASADQSSMG